MLDTAEQWQFFTTVEGLEMNDVYSICRHAGICNYESGCILQSMTHHAVSMMTEFRRGFAL